MLPRNRHAVVIAAPAVLLAAAIALFAVLASSARAGTAAPAGTAARAGTAAPTAAQPDATCQGHSGAPSSCDFGQQVLMPLKASIWVDASPEQGQQATVSWTVSCAGNGGSTNAAGATTGTVPFRAKIGVPQSGGADCNLSASVRLNGSGIVNAGLYYTLGVQVMISLPTGDTRPGAPLAYFKCLTDKYNSNRAGAQVVLGGCGSIYANTWWYDGSHLGHGGLCLTDPHNGGSYTRLLLERCTNSPDQAWSYRQSATALYAAIVLHARGGRMCMDDPRYSQRTGTPITLFTCTGGPDEGWTMTGR